MIDALGLIFNSHTMRISFPLRKADAIQSLLYRTVALKHKASEGKGRSQHGREPRVSSAAWQVVRVEDAVTNWVPRPLRY